MLGQTPLQPPPLDIHSHKSACFVHPHLVHLKSHSNVRSLGLITAHIKLPVILHNRCLSMMSIINAINNSTTYAFDQFTFMDHAWIIT